MHQAIPEGYHPAYRYQHRVMATIREWDPFLCEGRIFWYDFVTKNNFDVPFALEQIVSPDPRETVLPPIIRRGLGVEFVPIIKTGMDLYSCAGKKITDEIIVHNLHILTSTLMPRPKELPKPLKGFLLRREDLCDGNQ